VSIDATRGAAADLLAPLADPAAKAPDAAPGPSFADQLVDLLRDTDRSQQQAEQGARDLAVGRGDVVETMVSLSKAELSLRLVTEVRNRALEAYNEIMRLQV